jgi:hypothetical protein
MPDIEAEKERLMARLRELAGPLDEEDDGSVPPGRVPDRFSHLTKLQRAWLAGKSQSDLARLDALPQMSDAQLAWLVGKNKADLDRLDGMLADYQAAKIIGRAGKVLLWVVGGAFGTAFALAKFGLDVFSMFKSSGR